MSDGRAGGSGRRRGGTPWWIPALGGVALGLALGLAFGGDSSPGTAAALPAGLEYGERPARGPDDAPVTVVEYTDYQCPFCSRYHDEVYPNLMAEYGDRIRYVVRHFPLRNLHPQAQISAQAAVCAWRQGQFWEFHELIFTDRAGGLGRDLVERHAGTLGLDMDRFDRCLDSQAAADVVAGDFLDGVSKQIRSTPSFWIDGQLLVGYQPLEAFREVLDPMLGNR